MKSSAEDFRFLVCAVPVVHGADAKKARQWIGCTQRIFAKHMGVSVRTVMRWEANPNHWITQPCLAREIKSILTWTA